MMLQQLGAEVFGFGLDLDSSNRLFKEAKLSALLSSEKLGDIRDYTTLSLYFEKVRPDYVIHLAAQSLVRRSYLEPLETVSTNVLGSANVLIAALNVSSIKLILNVTTDKVYKNDSSGIPFVETDRLGGDDIYSGSKAAVELISHSINSSVNKTGIPIVNVRAGNVIGGGDWAPDRLIPDIARSVSDSSALIVRNPTSTRPWQHVFDCLHGYLLIVQRHMENPKNVFPKEINFGPADSMSVQDVLDIFSEEMGLVWETSADQSLLPEKKFLSIDSKIALETFQWKPILTVDEAVRKTAHWYKSYFDGENPHTLVQNEIQWFLEKVK